MILSIPYTDLLSLLTLLVLWVSYTLFAKYQAKKTDSLSSAVYSFSQSWASHLLQRNERAQDILLVANSKRHVNFFASTTVIVIAALLTLLSNFNQVSESFQELPYINSDNRTLLALKIMTLIAIFIYAFFSFTWALRQYTFCLILVGATPYGHNENNISFSLNLAKIFDLAGHSYNYGLRAYYFSMPVLAWFFHYWAFISSIIIIIVILYRREFHSKSLRVMNAIHISQDTHV